MRVLFGAGKREAIGAEIGRFDARRVLVLCTPARRGLAETVGAALGERLAGIFDGAVMHVPVAAARAAADVARYVRADCLVAAGGGSTIGLAKALALETGLPIVALPTTYSGSEMTPIYGLTEDGLKSTGRDTRVLPRVTIYDPELTFDLDAETSAASGLNALAHAVEALYAPDLDPISELMAQESVGALGRALPDVVRNPRALGPRTEALYGAWLAGAVLGAVSMGLHHKLCHTLGGTFGLPHAQTHAVLLPHVMAYNAAAAPGAMARVARALDAASAPAAVYDLGRALGAPRNLAELGMRASDLDRAAATAARSPYDNPRPVDRDGLRIVLQSAFDGLRPSS